jgi:lysozyme
MAGRKMIAREGLELIKSFEGLRLRPARLPDGRLTIGYGHTRSTREGIEVTAREAELLLIYDLMPVIAEVESLLTREVSELQFAALVSFAHNIGLEAFAGSEVLRLVNEGAHERAASALDAWRSGEVAGHPATLAVLVRRRAAEKALYLSGVSTGATALPTALMTPREDAEASAAVPDAVVHTHAPLDGAEARVLAEVPAPPAPFSPAQAEAVAALLGESPLPQAAQSTVDYGDASVEDIAPDQSDESAISPVFSDEAGGRSECKDTEPDPEVAPEPVTPASDNSAPGGHAAPDDHRARTQLSAAVSMRLYSPYAGGMIGALPIKPAAAADAGTAAPQPPAVPAGEALASADTLEGLQAEALQGTSDEGDPGENVVVAFTPQADPQFENFPTRYDQADGPAADALSRPDAPVEDEPQTISGPVLPPDAPAPSHTALQAPAGADEAAPVLVLTPPPDVEPARADRLGGRPPHMDAPDADHPILFEDSDDALSLRPVLRHEESEQRRSLFDLSEAGAFVSMGAVGLVAFAAAMGGFQLAASSESNRAINETAIVAWLLAGIGAVCVGVSAYNLFKRWGQKANDASAGPSEEGHS